MNHTDTPQPGYAKDYKEPEPMVSWIRAYLKLVRFHKTPFIFLLDIKYKMIGRALLDELAVRIRGKSAVDGRGRYQPDFNDCNDFAWRFKAEASHLKENGVGFVIGFSGKTLHCWNNALCPDGIYQVEPQNGYIFKKDKKYGALIVII